MDYVLTHTLVYGIIGGVFVYYLAYCKLLQISIGATFIGLAFALAKFFNGDSLEASLLALGLLTFYTLLQWIMLRFFPHQSQRDIFSIMFTLGAALVIENALGLLFGSAPVSLPSHAFSTLSLV